MQKPDFLILDEQFKILKLKKKVVETELDMPLNSLSSMLSGKRNIPDKWLIVLKKYVESKGGSCDFNDYRSNPLINAARGRDKSGVNEDEVKRKISVPAKESDNPLGLSPYMLLRQKSKGGIK